jgi:hypothetical protein
MPRPFLTARWTNLVILSYAVPPALLKPRLPRGLELDTRGDHAFVSLVAFDFLDAKVFGIPWPGHRHFPELNLRYYVRAGGDRGVVFLREFAPKRLVCLLANWLYCENYVKAPLRSLTTRTPDSLTVELTLDYGGRTHRLAATGGWPPQTPPPHSVEHFFKEHRWGFGCDRRGRGLRYEVVHPVWQICPVRSYQLDLDWGAVYGAEWKFLQGREPYSVVLALGSEVEVYPKGPVAPD